VTSLRDKIARAARRFGADSGGNALMLFGFALLPVLGLAGAAVDYGRASKSRTDMQAALDTTVLMVAQQAASQTAAQLTASATKDFNAMFTQPEVSGVKVTATYSTTGGSQVAMTASGTLQSDFAWLFGIKTMTIGTTSTATWGNNRLRVALVLDNTGSMADSGKITALKAATHSLLGQLQGAAGTSADVYTSIIPFGKDVNAGSTNYAQSWVRWDLWDAANGTCSKSRYTPQATCVAAGGKWTPASHSTWNGCLTDRDQNDDTTADVPVTGSTATLFPAEQYAYCPVSLMGLSNDWTALSNKVDAMTPNGNTNQTIGLQWGLQSLVAGNPLAVPALDPNYNYTQVIVLLTDGLNTQNRWSTDQSTIDTRTLAACTNAKQAGIVIYTIQVDTGGDPTSTMLPACATDSSKFFLLTSSSQILSVFTQIGTALSQLRISS